MSLTVLETGPRVSIQDLGRPGFLSQGVSRGGAMDRLAIVEGAALLGQSSDLAALEMASLGGRFRADRALRIALTGAPMRASVAGQSLAWHTSHAMAPGDVLEIGPAISGSFGYLHLGGGIDVAPVLDARAADLKSGLRGAVEAGDVLPIGADAGGDVGLMLDVADRFTGGTVRILPTAQTDQFPQALRDLLSETRFARDPRSNRQAVQLSAEGTSFALEAGLSVLSEITQPGDIQITGDGTPMILMAEAQTTGGYPRIATVLPCDLPVVAQAPAGAGIRLEWISIEAGLAAERAAAATRLQPRPRVRDPRDMGDLLSYRLVDGAITGWEDH